MRRFIIRSKSNYAQVYNNYTIWKRKRQVSSKNAFYVKCPYFTPQKSSHSRNCESLIINYSIGSDIHVYTDVTLIMEFTLLGLSFEVHLRIALKQRKIADFEIVLNYLFSLIAAC